ncbi:unnamed protein product [Arctia plantaginis]|uniref:Uncharacterized protein n=1 Tax=Arctia plantaginis TaxID=874455 RepID=A0A8S0ZXB2_ARCPL|nr:unnamed protein product [Arctia plantaginis]
MQIIKSRPLGSVVRITQHYIKREVNDTFITEAEASGALFAEGKVNVTTNDQPVETRDKTKDQEATETEAPKGREPIGSGAVPVASGIQVPEFSHPEATLVRLTFQLLTLQK